mmetsp:Transcript_40924/g.97255  ORF Transcript_40924/g.97255 Transcript_40924/m.97255 type:complete len:396 (-) Transcript_40924:322-1509(-)
MDSVFQINYLELLEEKSNEHAHMSKKISAAFGSQGPGFLIVTHVPGVTDIRSALFAATARAAKLSDRDLRLLRSESALGSDISSRGVPPQQRRVTTFSRQIEVPESSTLRESYRPDFASSGLSLGEALHELASIIFRVGLLLLDLCDSCFSSGGVLGKAVKECGSAKARLVHYHKEGPPRKKGKAPKAELWQDWHCDYGLLTGCRGRTISSSRSLPTRSSSRWGRRRKFSLAGASGLRRTVWHALCPGGCLIERMKASRQRVALAVVTSAARTAWFSCNRTGLFRWSLPQQLEGRMVHARRPKGLKPGKKAARGRADLSNVLATTDKNSRAKKPTPCLHARACVSTRPRSTVFYLPPLSLLWRDAGTLCNNSAPSRSQPFALTMQTKTLTAVKVC